MKLKCARCNGARKGDPLYQAKSCEKGEENGVPICIYCVSNEWDYSYVGDVGDEI